jgi:3-phosphoshikimate 1-carboxyvinyltransferase
MDREILIPFGNRLSGKYTPPPSKSHTIRALLVSSMAEEESMIRSPSLCDDAKHLKKDIEKWRTIDEMDDCAIVRKGEALPPPGRYYAGGSATVMRFLLAIFSFLEDERIIEGDRTLKKRPVGAGIEIARTLGVDVAELGEKGRLPLAIKGSGSVPGLIKITDTISSQFISGLMIASPLGNSETIIEIGKAVSFPYINMTAEVMKRFGIEVSFSGNRILIPSGKYKGSKIEIEKDYSAASFFFVGAGITESEITAEGLSFDSIQGDSAVMDFLQNAGMEVIRHGSTLKASGPPRSGIDLDVTDCPDLFPPLAVLALKCQGPSFFRNAGRLETKESGRGRAVAAAINRIGGKAAVENDLITIIPQKEYKGAVLDPENDHRLAMAFALMGLVAKGTSVLDPECVKKSYPTFWDDFFKLSV